MPKLVFSTPTPQAIPILRSFPAQDLAPIVISFSPASTQVARTGTPILPAIMLGALLFSLALSLLTLWLLWEKFTPALSISHASPLLASEPILQPEANAFLHGKPLRQTPLPQKNHAISPPPAAFNAELVPLSGKVIMGRDFYSDKAAPNSNGEAHLAAVDIVPLLEKLPLAQKAPARSPAGFFVDVDEGAAPRSLLEQADEAALGGARAKALKLYIHALRKNPASEKARHNIIALLLEDAASYDEAGHTAKAIKAYKRALAYAGADNDIAESIRARIGYLQQG